MTARPLSCLPLAFLLTLALACPASTQEVPAFTDNHPGLWVEWLARGHAAITGCALADADQDGDPDLFVVEQSYLELWTNDGQGTFVPDHIPLTWFPVAEVVALDFDGDGRSD